MIQAKEVLGFIEEKKTLFQNKINLGSSSEEELKYFQQRIDAFSEVESWIAWLIKSSEEKQVARIQQLASMRKVDALPHFIKNQERIINSYNLFRNTLIYINALQTENLNSLKSFCEEQLNKIDFNPSNFIKEFPTVEEIKTVFNTYFEITKPAKGNGNMFEECYEKIEHLYNELLKASHMIDHIKI